MKFIYLTYLFNIWLIISIIYGIWNSYWEYLRLNNEDWEKIKKIHERSFLTYLKLESFKIPNLLDMLLDALFLIKNINLNFKVILKLILTLILLIKLKKITILYIIVFYLLIFKHCANIYYYCIIKKDIEYGFKEHQSIENNLKNTMRMIATIMNNWALLIVYIIHSPINKFRFLEAGSALSLIILGCGMWYIRIIYNIVDFFEEIAYSKIWKRKHYSAYPKIIKNRALAKLNVYAIKSLMRISLITGKNKIIIKSGKITLNGKKYEVLVDAIKGTPEIIQDATGMTSVVTNAGGFYHQAFIFGGRQDFMLILTHSNKLELPDGGIAEGKKIYTQYKEQNCYFSFVDHQNTEITVGHKISVFGANGLYDFGQYVGFLLRSAVCKNCWSQDYLLYQNSKESHKMGLPDNKNINKLHEATIKSTEEFRVYAKEIAKEDLKTEKRHEKIADILDHISNQELFELAKRNEGFSELLKKLKDDFMLLKDYKI